MTDVPEHVPTPLEVAQDVVPLDLVEPGPEVVVLDDVIPDPVPLTPAEVVAAAVLAVPGVVALHGGRFGGLGTYLPGRLGHGREVGDDDVHLGALVVDPDPGHPASGQVGAQLAEPPPVKSDHAGHREDQRQHEHVEPADGGDEGEQQAGEQPDGDR